jgi:polyhydroxyalkanoate synthesis regulator phasin
LTIKRKREAEEQGKEFVPEVYNEVEIDKVLTEKPEKKPSKLKSMLKNAFNGKNNEALGFPKKKASEESTTETATNSEDELKEQPRLRDMTPEQRENYLKSKLR